ncbi:hypothetical protein B7463_g12179, partial [Scytalidium lignicola]
MASENRLDGPPEEERSVLNSDSEHHNGISETHGNPPVNPEYVHLERQQTQRSVREPTYDPINVGDREELHRIATSYHDASSINLTGNSEEANEFIGRSKSIDPSIDPKSPSFDIYQWIKILMKLIDENNIVERRAGVVFKNVAVSGIGSSIHLQNTVGSFFMAPFRPREIFHKGPERIILHDFNGSLRSGEMLVVLGRPGSGCSTFLKSLMGEHNGLHIQPAARIHYNGIPQKRMIRQFKGEIIYNQEVDKHFPHLTVGETLEFAARARTPQHRVIQGVKRDEWAKYMARVVMTVFGLSHTYYTKVGNEYVRGVSGGERKRVSIAEMALAGSPIAAWDNSTRGLDAATALEFTKSLRISADLRGNCHLVAIYQASQAIYDLFDKAIVLYEGREIYFGPCDRAKQYFLDMGWECPPRQTTGDFLTSITNPVERKPRIGFEHRVPRTSEEFEDYWKRSPEYETMLGEIRAQEEEFPMGGKTLEEFERSHKDMQAKHTRPKSPYMVSIPMQVRYCTIRAYQRLWNDRASTLTQVFGMIFMSLVIGSIFYGTREDTSSFFQKGGVLFFGLLLNALMAVSEINTLYAQRPIVEKQKSYAFYHPFTEALAGVVSDIPVKFAISTCFNIILYFLSGLRREPSQFFIFHLFTFAASLTMSQIYRSIAAATKTVSQALAIAGIITLAIVIYTGFIIPRPLMHPWFKWISWINPIAYTFEAIFTNELHGRQFTCSNLVPHGGSYIQTGNIFICAAAGAKAGQTTVQGDDYLWSQYKYSYSHTWRNLGFMFAFMICFLAVYLIATELNSSTDSHAEVLVFRRGHVPKQVSSAEKVPKADIESPSSATTTISPDDNEERVQNEKLQILTRQTEIFTWRDVCYDIKVKDGHRRLLDNVSGWVKPGTLTALMGVSGAGKTTLLDVLAQRGSIGVVTGDMFISGKPLDASFQRKTRYVQQQDLHLETTSVREALQFSAMLRQPKTVPKKEKYAFVEDVIKMLNMEDFAEAVVGVPGEGLNVEQRKLLTIGVELAAKPALLLFLDEPTSGLDSQSSWAIVSFLRKLANHGQAVLATIHQPSAILFQEFDRLLFLEQGGKTVYFGDIGKNSKTLLDYFESNGAEKCSDDDNPAEYIFAQVGAGATGKSTKDWHDVWMNSPEYREVDNEITRINQEMASRQSTQQGGGIHDEFAMPFKNQLWEVTVRVFQQYWRMPGYIYQKMFLGLSSSLFNGFSFFHANSSLQGIQDVIFSIFMITTIFTVLVQQIMPRFVLQRDLYEVRERPSKAYSWKAFLMANIIVEIPYQILLGVIVYACYYYPVYTEGGIPSSQRQGLILLLLIQFFVFNSTYSHMVIAALPDADTAGRFGTIMFAMTLAFNGVFQPPKALPGFWIFMYRVSPLTYFVSAVSSAGLAGKKVVCADYELSIVQPAPGMTCGQYLEPYANAAGGAIYNPNATADCQYCSASTVDQFLATVNIHYSTRWRDFGIGWSYIVFNIFMAAVLYYLFRVRKGFGLRKLKGKIAKFFGSLKQSWSKANVKSKKREQPIREE